MAATHFYDDFSHIDPRVFAIESCQATEDLFTLLGWSYKSDADQLLPTAPSFTPLGVSMDFSRAGLVVVGNTTKRVTHIQADIERLIALEVVAPSSLASLIGVSQFAESQTCGRTGSMILKELRTAARDLGPAGKARLHRALGDLGD